MLIVPKQECRETYSRGKLMLASRIVDMIAAHADPAACLVWPFAKDQYGYGRVLRDGRYWGTHRLAYTIVHGPIPPGQVVMHSCDHPPCFNPHHLSLGTKSENASDRIRKGRSSAPRKLRDPGDFQPRSSAMWSAAQDPVLRARWRQPTQSARIAEMIRAHAGSDACLVWPFKKRPTGYGVVRHNGEDWRVHRLAYKIVHGRIPRGMIIMHSCDNPPCFNPKHLSLGTRTENAADRTRKGRSIGPRHPRRGPRGPNLLISGELNVKSKLNNAQVREIRRRSAAGSETQQQIADEFGVCQNLISKIVLRRTWKHLK